MRRILILACAVGLGALTFANPADACHHRRARRHGCGGCGDGGYAPAYYDGNYAPSGVPTPPGPPAPPAPPPAPRAT